MNRITANRSPLTRIVSLLVLASILGIVVLYPRGDALLQGNQNSDGSDGVSGPSALGQADRVDEFVRVFGFRVEIAPGPSPQLSQTWQSLAGGDIGTELVGQTTGTDQFQTSGAGLLVVSPVTLTGRITPGGGGGGTAVFTNNFTVDLDEDITKIVISPLEYPAVDSTQTAQAQYRSFQPGPPPHITIDFTKVRSDNQNIREWWTAISEGQNDSREINVVAHDQSLTPRWSAAFTNCTIVAFSPFGNGWGSAGSSGAAATETFSVNCDGSPAIESPRADIHQWLEDLRVQGAGGDLFRNLSIVRLANDGADAQTTTYFDTFITKYEFPIFDAAVNDAFAVETVVIQPGRIEFN